MSDRKLTILVPSRNRADLARRTVESLLAQDLEGVSIVVSDNSTDQRAREDLAALCGQLDGVDYMRPPADLAMTDHWNWAFGQLQERFAAPLVTMVTDRMVMRPGALSRLLQLAEAHPERVITYNHDAVDDATSRVRLHLQERSGRAFELDTEHVLRRCSRVYFHPCIPRMMNCIVPLAVLDGVRAQFGNLFASISPDHCFAFRCLDAVDTIVYYDACPLIHYALTRSNGASYARGLQSAEVEDFQRHLEGVQMNASAPVPAFHSITNAVVNEYCFVREESQSHRLPPLDVTRYLGAMSRDAAQLEDPRLREQMHRLLEQNGWRHKRPLYWLSRARDALELALRHPGPFLRTMRPGLVGRLPGKIARLLGDGERDRSFTSSEQALEYLMEKEAPPTSLHLHLLPLILPQGVAREIPAS